MCAWRGSLLWGVLYTDDSHGCRGGVAEEDREERKADWGCGHTLTLEVAFPFKSPIPLRYAELMQDRLRQWGNTAELCSLCCQQACKEEEGERARTGGGVRERERVQTMSFCSGGNAAVNFAALWKHITTKSLRVCAEKFSSSPPCVWCGPRLISRYTFISSLVLFSLYAVSLYVYLFAKDSILLKLGLQDLIYVCHVHACGVAAPGWFCLISFSPLCTSNNQTAASPTASQLAVKLHCSLIHV